MVFREEDERDRAQIKKDIATELSCSISLIRDATSDADQQMREERKEAITDLYLKAYTAEEIGAAVGLKSSQANEALSPISTELVKPAKVTFSEEEWKPPIYNVWSFAYPHQPLCASGSLALRCRARLTDGTETLISFAT